MPSPCAFDTVPRVYLFSPRSRISTDCSGLNLAATASQRACMLFSVALSGDFDRCTGIASREGAVVPGVSEPVSCCARLRQPRPRPRSSPSLRALSSLVGLLALSSVVGDCAESGCRPFRPWSSACRCSLVSSPSAVPAPRPEPGPGPA